MIGKNLESACRAYAYRTAAQLHVKADKLADRAATLTPGSDEWRRVVQQFAQVSREAAELGFPIIK